jgi:hypothetical protein
MSERPSASYVGAIAAAGALCMRLAALHSAYCASAALQWAKFRLIPGRPGAAAEW